MRQVFQPVSSVKGTLALPGDKSISHRAVFFSAMAKGKSEIRNCLNSQDVNSTINLFRSLGCKIERKENLVVVEGAGFKGFSPPKEPLDAGNSGTTARLAMGVLAAQNFSSTIIGDDSLSKRPMLRIVEPLRLMGAELEPSSQGTLPVTISPVESLQPISYRLPIASAQLKSSILLAGLHLQETTTVIEPVQSRNHTEVMLGLKVTKSEEGNVISVSKDFYPQPKEYFVPSDISTAAFFIALALLTKNSELKIKNVLLNETRTGVLEVFKLMGGKIFVENEQVVSNERFGDLIVQSSELHNVEIEKELIPNIIDEIPIIAVAGIFAEGNFRIRNAEELRKKESDRIKALVENFRLAGVEVEEFEDGFETGNLKKKNLFNFNSFADHRIAMAFAIFSMVSPEGGSIDGFESVAVSNPDFISQINSVVQS